MNPRRKARRSFVTTFAATVATSIAAGGALLVGCTETETTYNPPAPGDTVCPAARPTSGEPCQVTKECTYDDCYGTPSTQAKCVGGKWSVMETSCNPPPPDAGDAGDAGDANDAGDSGDAGDAGEDADAGDGG